MGRVRIFPYKLGSKSAKELAKGLDALRVKPAGQYRPRQDDMIINWGNTNPPQTWAGQMLNPPEKVAKATHKLDAFLEFDRLGVRTVPWTVDKMQANKWIQAGKTVLIRGPIKGHGGAGIIVANMAELGPHALQAGIDKLRDKGYQARFFTQYVENDAEYRVHVFRGQVIDFVQKKAMGKEKLEERGIKLRPFIRNHDNGWVFARQDVELPDDVAAQAIHAVKVLGLDFGAVDVIQQNNNHACVLEVNTAPGLEGTTLQKYIEAFKGVVK